MPGGNSKATSIDGEHGWFVVRTEHTDAEGWPYGTAFDHLEESTITPPLPSSLFRCMHLGSSASAPPCLHPPPIGCTR